MDQRAGRADEPHNQGGNRQRYHYDSHDQLRQHLGDFVVAYNFGRRLKTLKGLTPYEAICKAWQNHLPALQQIRTIKCRDQTANPVATSTIAGAQSPLDRLTLKVVPPV